MDKKIALDYDEKGDILEVHLGEPCEAVGEEISEDVFVHYDLETSEIVGLTLFNFRKRFAQAKTEPMILPLTATFTLAESVEVASA